MFMHVTLKMAEKCKWLSLSYYADSGHKNSNQPLHHRQIMFLTFCAPPPRPLCLSPLPLSAQLPDLPTLLPSRQVPESVSVSMCMWLILCVCVRACLERGFACGGSGKSWEPADEYHPHPELHSLLWTRAHSPAAFQTCGPRARSRSHARLQKWAVTHSGQPTQMQNWAPRCKTRHPDAHIHGPNLTSRLPHTDILNRIPGIGSFSHLTHYKQALEPFFYLTNMSL